MKKMIKYSQELKAEAVRMCIEQGLSQKEVARRLSIPAGTLSNWVMAMKSNRESNSGGDRTQAEPIAENARLRKELNETRMEKEILSKAA